MYAVGARTMCYHSREETAEPTLDDRTSNQHHFEATHSCMLAVQLATAASSQICGPTMEAPLLQDGTRR